MHRNCLYVSLILSLLVVLPASADSGLCVDKRLEILQGFDSLPVSLEELSAHPVATRRILFSALDAETKSDFWRTHLREYVDANPGLKEVQLRVIEHAMAFATPALFSMQPDDVLWEAVVEKPLEGLRLSANKVFSEDEVQALFSQLGPREASPLAFKYDACECSTSVDFCGSSSYCRAGGCGEHIGCGLLWLQLCNGNCIPY